MRLFKLLWFVNFFKEQYCKSQIIPAFPAGRRGVVTQLQWTERVHPCVGSLNHVPFLIQLFIKADRHFFMIEFWVFADICNYTVSWAYSPEIRAVESGIGVVENPVDGYARALNSGEYFSHGAFNLMHIVMIAFHWLRHCQRQSLTVCEVDGICGLASFTPLICSDFPSFCARCVASVGMCYGQVNRRFVVVLKSDKHVLPITAFAPLAIMMEDGAVLENNSAEKVLHRQMLPLTTRFKFIQNGVDYLDYARFGYKTSFCYGKMREYLIFYCIFVEYSVIHKNCNYESRVP